MRGDLDWIVMKCLEKDRTRRYETANGLASDLKRHLDNEPVARPSAERGLSVSESFSAKQAGLQRWNAVAAALLLALGALSVSTVLITREQKETRQALDSETRGEARIAAGPRPRTGGLLLPSHHPCPPRVVRRQPGGALKYLNECPQDLRGWEWRYLTRLGRIEPFVLRDTNAVHAVAFHPDGQRVAAGCGDGAVRIWELATGKVIQTLPGHEQYVFCVEVFVHRMAGSLPPPAPIARSGCGICARAGRFFGLQASVASTPAWPMPWLSAPMAAHLTTPSADGAVIIRNASDGSEVARLPARQELPSIASGV